MILIASCYYQKNYGSMLQAFATQEVLNKLGIDNRTINCQIINTETRKKKYIYYLTKIYRIDSFSDQLKRILFNFRVKTDKNIKNDFLKRFAAFERFGNLFNLTTPYSLHSLNELCSRMNVKAVIVGSDQLWLPSNIYANYYTLNFVPRGINRISYSTSFGVSKLDKSTVHRTGFLKEMSNISVREETGAKIVEKITGQRPTLVCDPTILFTADQWKEILNIKKTTSEKYIFCYFLGNNPWQREWAKELKKKTGLKIISLLHLETYIKSDCNYSDETPFDVDPAKFVEIISNAQYVCTDSFHCTVFSLLFNKKFFSFRRFRDSHTASTNSRIYFFLEQVGLKERIISRETSVDAAIAMDYNSEEVNKYFDDLRTRSLEWLKKSLGDLYVEGNS